MIRKRGLQLDRVVLLGRTLEEYAAFFGFAPHELSGLRLLDVASGVSSFSAEANERGIAAVACDPIYGSPVEEIEARCVRDLDKVAADIGHLDVYRWERSYKTPSRMKELRQRSYRTFLKDYRAQGANRYMAGSLPSLPFAEGRFDVTFCSYLLFAYQDHLSYEFHRHAIRDLMRVTRGEARIYPLITFEGERSDYVDKLKGDSAINDLRFEEIATDFEFLVGSNSYLKITHA